MQEWAIAEADTRNQYLADDHVSQLEFCTPALLSEDYDQVPMTQYLEVSWY